APSLVTPPDLGDCAAIAASTGAGGRPPRTSDAGTGLPPDPTRGYDMTGRPRRLFTNRDLGLFHAAADGGQPFDVPTRTVRLLLRDPDEHSTGVDGAWWPRGDN